MELVGFVEIPKRGWADRRAARAATALGKPALTRLLAEQGERRRA